MTRARVLLPVIAVGLLPSMVSAGDPRPATVPPPSDEDSCPAATIEVANADELRVALEDAEPGDVIRLADGTYVGTFATTVAGTAERPIFLCGSAEAILDGDNIRGGYGLHLDHASYWHLVGFTVRNAQKGVMVDNGSFNVIQGLTVAHLGDEGIHLRTNSTDNVVRGNSISGTGLRRDKFGEGVYVGSAESNWCRYTDCEPDNSDRNVIENNTIFLTAAESVDLKEGTSDCAER